MTELPLSLVDICKVGERDAGATPGFNMLESMVSFPHEGEDLAHCSEKD